MIVVCYFTYMAGYLNYHEVELEDTSTTLLFHNSKLSYESLWLYIL